MNLSQENEFVDIRTADGWIHGHPTVKDNIWRLHKKKNMVQK